MNYVDLFFTARPTEEIHHSKVDCIYAIAKVERGALLYWHAIVTPDQYNWRISNGKSCVTWDEWVKGGSNRAKKIKDHENKDKDCPYHAFGKYVYDPKKKKLIVPQAGKKDIDLTQIPLPFP